MSYSACPLFPDPDCYPEQGWFYRIFLGIEHQANRKRLAGLLNRRYSLQELPSWQLQWGNAFDLCIFDSLFFGRHAQQIVEQRVASSPIFLPFLLLLKPAHLSLLTVAQRQQIDDVITTPVDQVELIMRIESLLRARQQSLKLSALLAQEQLLEQQLLADNKILQEIAAQDALTGIANRRAFDEKLAYEWKLGRREQVPLAVVLCDVDHFKAYNDIYGHILGDQCLKAIAGVLDTTIRRPADMVARYGGEEFALILPHTDLEGALHILTRIQQTLQARALPHKQSPTSSYVSLSLGLAIRVPQQDTGPEALLQLADDALYWAKAEGRNCIKVAPMSSEAVAAGTGPEQPLL